MKRFLVSLVLLSCSVFWGCGGGEPQAEVHGVLIRDGNPVLPKEDEEVSISFMPTREGGVAGSVNFDPATGGFSVVGPSDRGIPPGDYRIAVSWGPYGSGVEEDRLKGVFADDVTPLGYQVTEDSVQHIVVDLTQKKVTKKAP